MTKLEEIRARLDAATPGPWRVVQDGNWLEVAGPDGAWGTSFDGPDVEFVANAPGDIAFLLAEVDRLKAKSQRYPYQPARIRRPGEIR